MEQAKEDWIIDVSPINLSKPFHPLDHVSPKAIVKEKVWVHIPPPLVMNDSLVVWFSSLHDPVEGILGNLSISVSVSIKKQRGKLPHKLMGSGQTPKMECVPSHPSDG